MQLTKIGAVENGCLELADIPVPEVGEKRILSFGVSAGLCLKAIPAVVF